MMRQISNPVPLNRFDASHEGRKAFLVSPDDTCLSNEPVKLDFNDLLKTDPTGESIRTRFSKQAGVADLEWKPPIETEKEEIHGTDDYYPESTIEALVEMNKEYAAVLIGGDFRIAKEGFDQYAKKNTLSFLKITSLHSYYQNTTVFVKTSQGMAPKELSKVWMAWSERRSYLDVIFNPKENEMQKKAYNLFKGFPLTPKQGDWSLMRSHIFEIICNSNTQHFEYVMAWMARIVQDPGGDKPGVALVLKGGKGVGKGVFANYFGAIFGEAFLPIADADSFTGRFNMHLSKSLLVFLDEAVWGGDKKAEGKLKQLITEPTILFEPKGIDSITLRNYINIIIASNEDWVIPATGDERRFCVLLPSNKYQKDTVHFARILKEQREGGSEAMMYDLLAYNYKEVNLRTAPDTEGLSEQVQVSLPNVLEFWHSVLSRGYMLSDKDNGGRPRRSELIDIHEPDNTLWPPAVYKFEVYREYLNWCKDVNSRYPKNETQFWKATWKIWVGGSPKRTQKAGANSKNFDALMLPHLKESRAFFSKMTKIKFEETEETENPQEAFLSFKDQF